MIHLRPTSDWPVMLCDRLVTDPRPGRDLLKLPVWLGKSLHEIKIQEWLATDLRSCRMTYEAIEWFTTELRRFATKGGSSCELGHSQLKLTSSTTVFDFKSGRGAGRFQWRVSPSYCEYSGVTYNFLVSNIGGTYDLVDQLPSNHEFGHFFGRKSITSPSGVRCKPIRKVWIMGPHKENKITSITWSDNIDISYPKLWHNHERPLICHYSYEVNVSKPDHIPWWRHQIETFSVILVLCAGISPVTSDAELWWVFLFVPWINRWVNNRGVGDFRRQCVHYDVMS